MAINKYFKIISLMLFVVFTVPVYSSAAVNSTVLPSDSTIDDQIISSIMCRLTAIRQMDKANLTAAERKDLRKELREMKHQATEHKKGKGVYLSVGAILIIIILLLILLL